MVMSITIQNQMDMGTGVDMIFKNRYGCEYRLTHPTPIPT